MASYVPMEGELRAQEALGAGLGGSEVFLVLLYVNQGAPSSLKFDTGASADGQYQPFRYMPAQTATSPRDIWGNRVLILDSLLRPRGPRSVRLDFVKDFHVVDKAVALHCATAGAWTHPTTGAQCQVIRWPRRSPPAQRRRTTNLSAVYAWDPPAQRRRTTNLSAVYAWDPRYQGVLRSFSDNESRDNYEEMLDHSGIDGECPACDTRHTHSPEGPVCETFLRRRRDLVRNGTYDSVGPVLPRDTTSWVRDASAAAAADTQSVLDANSPELAVGSTVSVEFLVDDFETSAYEGCVLSVDSRHRTTAYNVRFLADGLTVRVNPGSNIIRLVRSMQSLPEDKVCMVCLEDFAAMPTNKSVSTLGCGHRFCSDCIENWFKSAAQRSCPVCRKCFAGLRRAATSSASEIVE
jgi:hypothetical protein